MAIFDTLDQLARTDCPARCRAVGLTVDATALEALLQIDRSTRLGAAAVELRALEDRIVASWMRAWDANWTPNTFRGLLVTDRQLRDFDAASFDEKLVFKTSLRVAELLMARAG